jgi:hypothetical protein
VVALDCTTAGRLAPKRVSARPGAPIFRGLFQPCILKHRRDSHEIEARRGPGGGVDRSGACTAEKQ